MHQKQVGQLTIKLPGPQGHLQARFPDQNHGADGECVKHHFHNSGQRKNDAPSGPNG